MVHSRLGSVSLSVILDAVEMQTFGSLQHIVVAAAAANLLFSHNPPLMNNYAAEALASLNNEDQAFLKALPKAELHAHLNGCIPLSCLQDLVRQRPARNSTQPEDEGQDEKIAKGLSMLEQGVILEEIHEFFDLFPAIYALTSTPPTLRQAARAVLAQFLLPQPGEGGTEEEEPAQCAYLELRTTPRENAEMSREQYLDAVLCEMEEYSKDKCALIVSVDRRMNEQTMMECVRVAGKLKKAGRRVIGIDLCGTPTACVSNSPWNSDNFGHRLGMHRAFFQPSSSPRRAV